MSSSRAKRLIRVHTAVVRNNKLKLLIPFRASVTASPLVKHLRHYLKYIFIVHSSNLKLIHHRSHTKARLWLTFRRTSAPSHVLTLQHAKRFQAAVRPSAAETQPPLAIHNFVSFMVVAWASVRYSFLSLQAQDVKVLSVHHNLYCRSSSAVVLRNTLVRKVQHLKCCF